MNEVTVSQSPTALIFGISGQDGAYLAKLLLDRGYSVHGTSRDKEISPFSGLEALNLRPAISLHSAALTDFRSVVQIMDSVRPTEVYNLAGQSSVGLSFQQPVETLDSLVIGTINILEAIRFLKRPTRFYNAGSGECFGNTDRPADEKFAFRPRSPYAVGKSAAFWTVANYRESYGLFACSGILFNHESPLRPLRFVTRKIVKGAINIAKRREESLKLGNIDIARDWGWAPEYVDAMWRVLAANEPDDFVIATGKTHTLREFVEQTFSYLGLNWADHVEVDETLLRPSDIKHSSADPNKAASVLGWRAQTSMFGVIERLIEAELRTYSPNPQNARGSAGCSARD